MYAVIADGASQYRVTEGLVFEVQRKDIAEETKSIDFENVMFVGDLEGGPKVGQPYVSGARVTASVIGELKGDKLIIRKQNRRKGYKLKKGHRQKYLQVKVETIQAS
ncbi:MAG: 50S ribosomal protein L21 [Planctomycetota bacterium]